MRKHDSTNGPPSKDVKPAANGEPVELSTIGEVKWPIFLGKDVQTAGEPVELSTIGRHRRSHSLFIW